MNNKYVKWFQRAMWFGIIADMLVAIPTVFFPNTMLRALGQDPSGDVLWTAFGGNMLFLLALMYIPAAKDPYRYYLPAKLAVLCRLIGVIFFLVLWPGRYTFFGLFDGFFFLIQAPLLYLAFKKPAPEWQPSAA